AGGGDPRHTTQPLRRAEDTSHWLCMTDLFDNAFHVLGATPRTTRATLVQLAEDAALGSNSHLATEAQATLGNPKSRLAAELAWLPGVSPTKASILIGKIKSK